MAYNKNSAGDQRKSHNVSKTVALCVSLVLVIVAVAGGTLAWLSTQTKPVVNTFSPNHIECRVEEKFDENTGKKENVKIKNTSDVNAYIRVKVVAYDVDEAGNILGGTGDWLSKVEFSEGNWFKEGEYYYFKSAVAPNEFTDILIKEHTLQKNQVLEILAEAIQSEPSSAVNESWKDVRVDENGMLSAATK